MMKKAVLLFAGCILSVHQMRAQIPVIEIIKQASVKVIKAADLMVQRMQNETIWLQNAQQTLENILVKTKLTEIGDWVNRQKNLYADYFDELSKVKTVIAEYHRVKSIIQLQTKLVREYQQAYRLFKNDPHFTPAELDYMGEVYTGILEQSVRNMGQMEMVIQAFTTTMTDAKRLVIINNAAEQATRNYSDLKAFNNQNKILSLQRSRSQEEAKQVRAMYGLE